MKRYRVRLTEEAEADVAGIYRFVRRKSASPSALLKIVEALRPKG